jgi:hypothetical protein
MALLAVWCMADGYIQPPPLLLAMADADRLFWGDTDDW